MCLGNRVRAGFRNRGEGPWWILTFSDGQLKLGTDGVGEDIAHLQHSLSVGLAIGTCSGLGDRVPRRWR